MSGDGERDSRPQAGVRPCVRGKFLFADGRKLQVHGVTYGPFAEWEASKVAADFAAMRRSGVNAVRLYAVPPRWLLDAAQEHGLWVMAGIAWEQHVAFLDERLADSICARVREGVRACAGHPALLCVAVGNEIPAAIVRWLGRRRVERFLNRLCRAVREELPGTLVTYVNYPSTEYLQVRDADVMTFNVYLERRERFAAYLGRLQNLAGDRPLLLGELGLDSTRNGEAAQAATLRWQLQCAAQGGCAGEFVFAWTDEWYRGGADVLDWEFGLTRRDRTPKPALGAVAACFADQPAAVGLTVSVVVCTHNGAATLADCLDGATRLHYPEYELIVVDDGSSDSCAAIAAAFGARVVRIAHSGLSAARNAGLRCARGEIVAYLDDDARPDPDWLTHIALGFEDPAVAAVGGPNILPPESGAVAAAVANAPGGPTHVLISDRDAEHLPGCNLAIRRAELEQIAGFDERFRVAGDDVDVCWRLLDAGHRLAFSPGAVVLHRRRGTVAGYLRQQRGYGRAEALLAHKWPERYSAAGHVTWKGRLYRNGLASHRGGWRWHVYYGAWGSGAFQPLYGPRRGVVHSLALLPEWYLVLVALAGAAAAGTIWTPLLVALPCLVAALGALVFDAAREGARVRFPGRRHGGRLRLLTAMLHLLQPPARLYGRLAAGLSPWRRNGPRGLRVPRTCTRVLWKTEWESPQERVRALAVALRERGGAAASGGDWDRWDLEVRGGALAAARVRLAVEEHGAGCQLVRVRIWPRLTRAGALVAGFAVAALAGAVALGASAPLLALAAAATLRLLYESASAQYATELALRVTAPQPVDAESEPRPEPRLELAPAEAGQ